ncbi:MAG: hypothetical protein U0R19_28835 [Bryobacteraceae bacterium]
MILWFVVLFAAAQAAAQSQAPVIAKAYHEATLGNEISPGCVVVVVGSILDPRVIRPTFRTPLGYELEGVRVTVNEVPAPLLRVDAARLAFVAPEVAVGDVVVKVSNAAGSGSVGMVMRTVSPGLVRSDQGANRVLLLRGNDGIEGAVRSGEMAAVLATGLGVLPPAKLDLWPFGQEVDRSRVTLRVGGVAARIDSMSVRTPGYYRILFEMPVVAGVSAASPRAPIVLELDGIASQAGLNARLDWDTETRIYTNVSNYVFVTPAGTLSAVQSFYAQTSPAGIALTVDTSDAPWLVMRGRELSADARGMKPGSYEGRIQVSGKGVSRLVPATLLVLEPKPPVLRRASRETVARGEILDLELYGAYLSEVERLEMVPDDGVRMFVQQVNMERIQARLAVEAGAKAGERRLRVVTRDGASSGSVALTITEGGENVTLESVLPAELLVGAGSTVRFRGSVFDERMLQIDLEPGEGLQLSNTLVRLTRVGQPFEQSIIFGYITVDETAAEGRQQISVVTSAGRSNSLPLYVVRARPEIFGIWPRTVWPGRIYTDVLLAGMELGSLQASAGEDLTIAPYTITFLTGEVGPTKATVQVSATAARGVRMVRLPAAGVMSNEAPIEVVDPPAEAPELLDVALDQRVPAMKGRLRFRDADGDLASPGLGYGARLSAVLLMDNGVPGETSPTSIPIHLPGVKEGSLDFEITLSPLPQAAGTRVAFWLEDAAGNRSNAVVTSQ